MPASCPACGSDLARADVDTAAARAPCRRCQQTFPLGEVMGRSDASSVDLSRPPKGAWFERTDRGFEVGASTYAPVLSSILLPFVCLWMVGAFGPLALELLRGELHPVRLLLFVPFFAATLVLIGRMAMALGGKVQVRVDGDEGEVFTGVGSFGTRQRFSWRGLTNGTITERQGRRSASVMITLDGSQRITFGKLLGDQGRRFVLAALRKMRHERRAP